MWQEQHLAFYQHHFGLHSFYNFPITNFRNIPQPFWHLLLLVHSFSQSTLFIIIMGQNHDLKFLLKKSLTKIKQCWIWQRWYSNGALLHNCTIAKHILTEKVWIVLLAWALGTVLEHSTLTWPWYSWKSCASAGWLFLHKHMTAKWQYNYIPPSTSAKNKLPHFMIDKSTNVRTQYRNKSTINKAKSQLSCCNV